MSLVNNLLHPIQPVNAQQDHKVYQIKTDDLVAGGAFTTVDIVLENYPAGAMLRFSRIKPVQSIAGAGPITAATARLFFGKAGSEAAVGSGAVDAFAAVGTTEGTSDITSTTAVAGDGYNANRLIARITTTGGNLSGVTAGAIEAVADVAELGF